MASNTGCSFRDSKQPEHSDAYDGDTEDTWPSKCVKKMHQDLLKFQDFHKMLTASKTSDSQAFDSVHTEMRPLDEDWDSEHDAEDETDDEYLNTPTATALDNGNTTSVGSRVSGISGPTDVSDDTEYRFPAVKHRRDTVEGDAICACEDCQKARSEMLNETVVRLVE